MSWNNQKVEDLKKLWNEGVATSQIGVQLGFTKNAVIGKAFRLGLERRKNSRKKSTQNQQFSSVTMYRETSNSSSQNTVRKEPIRRREKFSFKKKVSYASGCCFCMRTIDFKELGMFDETYGMYCEDVDLSLRVSNAKGIIKVIPKSRIWHHISKSIGGSHSISKWYKKNTSILKLIFKHSNPFFFPLAFVFFMINNLISLSLVVLSKFLIKK